MIVFSAHAQLHVIPLDQHEFDEAAVRRLRHEVNPRERLLQLLEVAQRQCGRVGRLSAVLQGAYFGFEATDLSVVNSVSALSYMSEIFQPLAAYSGFERIYVGLRRLWLGTVHMLVVLRRLTRHKISDR